MSSFHNNSNSRPRTVTFFIYSKNNGIQFLILVNKSDIFSNDSDAIHHLRDMNLADDIHYCSSHSQDLKFQDN